MRKSAVVARSSANWPGEVSHAHRARSAVRTVVLGGGVAANKALRSALEAACTGQGLKFHAAKMAYCTDNAAMIAALGYHQLKAGEIAGLYVDAYASAT